MITSKTLANLQEINEKTFSTINPPKRLFYDSKFNNDNWNGIESKIIKDIVKKFHKQGQDIVIIQPRNIFSTTDLIDATDYMIYTHVTCDYYEHITFLTKSNDTYLFKYSDNKGTMQYVKKNNINMTEEEYLELLNKFERWGYDLGIDN